MIPTKVCCHDPLLLTISVAAERLPRGIRFRPLCLLLSLLSTMMGLAVTPDQLLTGQDLLPVFARAHRGAPLRVVALGGSITQAGDGWIRSWLRDRFPESDVVVHNAGMSATGSDLALFRLDRDVIAFQPDLVFVEFSVNDGGAPEFVRWSVESLIRCLKSLPSPPAIVMLEAANRRRGAEEIPPQREVGAHYHLLTIDLQAALRNHLAEGERAWEDFMGDDVHPNTKGHAFYAEVIEQKLSPYLEASRTNTGESSATLPARLSPLPLLLDGHLQPVPTSSDWVREPSIEGWWNMFFNGAVASKVANTPLAIPFRGTTVGLFYPLDETYGMMLVSVDGHEPVRISCNHRKGYTYQILARDLPSGEHRLSVLIPEGAVGAAGVKLGYVLVGGDEGASKDRAPQGEWTDARMKALRWQNLPNRDWAWIGPFGNTSKKWDASDLHFLDQPFWPESEGGESPRLEPPADDADQRPALHWQPLEGDGLVLDLRQLTGWGDRGVSYVWTNVEVSSDCRVTANMIVDYYAKIWVNGRLVLEVREHHGAPGEPLRFPLTFESGSNHLLIKVFSGSMGNLLALSFEGEDFVHAKNPLSHREAFPSKTETPFPP